MGRKKIVTCKVCEKYSEKLSRQHMCPQCAEKRLRNNIEQMKTKNGPNWDKWKKGMSRAARSVDSA
jgi:hypothetical protein